MDRNEYRKDQNFWHAVFVLVYLILVGASLYTINMVRGAIPTAVPLLDLALIAFAVFRLIRLFTYDMVMSFVRDYFVQYEKGPGRTIWKLLDCPWCTGVWMAWVVVTAYFITPYAWYVIFLLAMAGAGSYLQIIIWKVGLEKVEEKETLVTLPTDD